MDKKVIVYVDGYNFYYGLKECNWKKFYWLDLVNFFQSFMGPNQELVKVKYFSAYPSNQGKRERQDTFFSANSINDRFDLILGSFLKKDVHCGHCFETFKIPEEKKTDVNIATHMISDCIYNECDITILVSGDSDLTPPIEFIKRHNPNHVVNVFFPPRRSGSHLKQITDNSLHLEQYKRRFSQSLLPNEIEGQHGIIFRKPDSWG